VSSSSYSLDANLTVLRFYQLSPDLAKKATVAKILLKALMALPAADYKVCMQMVPESLQVGSSTQP
jgi:translation initiation factor 3 subunit K